MVYRNVLLGTTAIASLALAACTSDNPVGAAAEAQITELGLPLGEAVSVLSSDRENGVGRNVTLTVQDFGEDAEGDLTFEIDIELPDGDLLTLTEADFSSKPERVQIDSMGPQNALAYRTTVGGGDTVPGDVVDVLIGFGVRDADLANDADPLMALARFGTQDNLDRAREYRGQDAQLFDVYAVTGELTETESLPTGWAEYKGNHVATIYVNAEDFGAPLTAEGSGEGGGRLLSGWGSNEDVNIRVDFDSGAGQAEIHGGYAYVSGADLEIVGDDADVVLAMTDRSYDLYSNDIQIGGAEYSGTIGFVGDWPEGGQESKITVPDGTRIDTVYVPDNVALWLSSGEIIADYEAAGGTGTTSDTLVYTGSEKIDLTGDIAGEFYGDAAQATGGVFAAEETATEAEWNVPNVEVDIIGGYVAYEDQASSPEEGVITAQ